MTTMEEIKEISDNMAQESNSSSGKIPELSIHDESFSRFPGFPSELNLPPFLQQLVSIADTPPKRDFLLLGALTAIGAVLDKVYFLHNGDKYFPNLYFLLSGPPASGKGLLKYTSTLIEHIDQEIKKKSAVELQEYYTKFPKGKNPFLNPVDKPGLKMLIIPGNNTASGLLENLYHSQSGIIIETEADTLAYSNNGRFGGFSDILRKAFGHERISSNRKTNIEYFEILEPKLSIILSCTPETIHDIIPHEKDGLFSRFMYYNIEPSPFNKKRSDIDLKEFFVSLRPELDAIVKMYNSGQVEMKLTDDQYDRLMNFIEDLTLEYSFQGVYFTQILHRFVIIAQRISAIFTCCRNEKPVSGVIKCSEQDLETVIQITESLIAHSEFIFKSYINANKDIKTKSFQKEQFNSLLPDEIRRQDINIIAGKIGVSQSKAYEYIRELRDSGNIVKLRNGLYHKNEKDGGQL